MARIVKSPQARRNEILDTAKKLFYLKGYQQTSVQDIITEIGIAKGTFYHYFDSKLDLLDAVIGRMIEQTLQTLEPLVADEQMSAPEKLTRFFSYLADWKGQNKAFFLDLMNIWYKDENAILRQKVETTALEQTAPLLAQIIEQGITEGAFAAEHPADTAEIVLQTGRWLSNTLAQIILNHTGYNDATALVERKIHVYHRAIERILNASAGSIRLFDMEQIKPWLEVGD